MLPATDAALRDSVLRLVILADTHIPRRARDLPDQVWAEVGRADVVVHAGDWVDPRFLDRMEAASRRLVAVHGNNDGPELRHRLPEVVSTTLAGLRVAVVHDSGPAKGRDARMAAAFPAADVVVFGHSHIPWDSREPDGPRLLNPGSPTDRRRQPSCTYLTASVRDGRLDGVVLHSLAPRVRR